MNNARNTSTNAGPAFIVGSSARLGKSQATASGLNVEVLNQKRGGTSSSSNYDLQIGATFALHRIHRYVFFFFAQAWLIRA